MHRLIKLAIGVLVLATVLPVGAQEVPDNVIIGSTFGSSTSSNFNPITSTTADAANIIGLLFPGPIGVDPETAQLAPDVEGALAESWDVSEDGTVYTVHLKDNFVWSDGTPVTAQDLTVFWEALKSGQVESSLAYVVDEIVDIEALDDYTIQVTFPSANCESIQNFGYFNVFPAHLVTDADGNIDFAAINEMTFEDAETALAVGPYRLSAQIPDQQTALVPSDVWPAEEGEVLNEGYIQVLIADQTIQMERIFAGDIDFTDSVPPDRRQQARELESLETYEFNPGNQWSYFAVNHADPSNPQPGRDEDGNEIIQDPHPIFADVRVRRALAHAINIEDVMAAAVFGEGAPMQSFIAPNTVYYPEDVPFYEYDPELAIELLAEAGWVDDDNDPSTPLVATEDALNAEPGTPFEFTLFTNQGNPTREAFGLIVQDQLGDIGIAVDFQAIDFNVLVDMIQQQTHDAVIIGWRESYPYSPNYSQIFSIAGDTIGGSNTSSWHNAEFDALMQEALFLPGCDLQEIVAIYGQAAQIWHEELPYIAQFGLTGMYAWQNNVEGVEPYPANLLYNMNEWTVSR